jgi:hypothetical protein
VFLMRVFARFIPTTRFKLEINREASPELKTRF